MPRAEPPGGRSRPPTRAERRRAARARRNRLLLGASLAVSAAVLVAWFPASDLLHQRHELAAASAHLHKVDQANRTLAKQRKELKTPAAVARIAEQQYELVTPGEHAYQVLPSSGSGGAANVTTPVVAGAGATSAPRAATTPGRHRSTPRSQVDQPSSSFFGRVLQTLEFWR